MIANTYPACCVSRVCPRVRLLCVPCVSPKEILHIATNVQVFAVSVRTAGERRVARIFPLVALWALVQRDRAGIALVSDEAGARLERPLLSRVMHLRIVGVFDRFLRFAFM